MIMGRADHPHGVMVPGFIEHLFRCSPPMGWSVGG